MLADLPQLRSAAAMALPQFLSDHRVIECDLDLRGGGRHDMTFSKQPAFIRPAWIDDGKWDEIFAEAWSHCQLNEWKEACSIVAKMNEEDSLSLSQDEDEEQQLVDYTWLLCNAMVLTAFRVAYAIALAFLPATYNDNVEICRVVHLSTHVMRTRLKALAPSRRDFPRSGEATSV